VFRQIIASASARQIENFCIESSKALICFSYWTALNWFRQELPRDWCAGLFLSLECIAIFFFNLQGTQCFCPTYPHIAFVLSFGAARVTMSETEIRFGRQRDRFLGAVAMLVTLAIVVVMQM
jgi:hypothetical protein